MSFVTIMYTRLVFFRRSDTKLPFSPAFSAPRADAPIISLAARRRPDANLCARSSALPSMFGIVLTKNSASLSASSMADDNKAPMAIFSLLKVEDLTTVLVISSLNSFLVPELSPSVQPNDSPTPTATLRAQASWRGAHTIPPWASSLPILPRALGGQLSASDRGRPIADLPRATPSHGRRGGRGTGAPPLRPEPRRMARSNAESAQVSLSPGEEPSSSHAWSTPRTPTRRPSPVSHARRR
mmetsp:Transcript_8804/g.20191  ORF Transcript_8804/g.20191 Transcript_8804/m.20191 type:complete len:241 (-) Transcript_8804:23-745(-)